MDVYDFDKCDNLVVNVIGEKLIEEGEYWFNDCYKTATDTWNCNCSDNYVLELEHKLNTINTYNISLKYNYSTNVQTGGGGRVHNNKITNILIPNEKQPLIDYRTKYNNSTPVFVDKITNKVIKDKETIKEIEDEVEGEEQRNTTLVWIIIGTLVVLITIGTILIRRKIKNENE